MIIEEDEIPVEVEKIEKECKKVDVEGFRGVWCDLCNYTSCPWCIKKNKNKNWHPKIV